MQNQCGGQIMKIRSSALKIWWFLPKLFKIKSRFKEQSTPSSSISTQNDSRVSTCAGAQSQFYSQFQLFNARTALRRRDVQVGVGAGTGVGVGVGDGLRDVVGVGIATSTLATTSSGKGGVATDQFSGGWESQGAVRLDYAASRWFAPSFLGDRQL